MLLKASLFCAGRFMPGKVKATLSRARAARQRQCAQGTAWKSGHVSNEVDGTPRGVSLSGQPGN